MGLQELLRTASNFQEARAEVYPVQIAFNVIPHGGDFTANGYTTEEMGEFEKGVIKNLAYTRYWAKKKGVEATPAPGANARS